MPLEHPARHASSSDLFSLPDWASFCFWGTHYPEGSIKVMQTVSLYWDWDHSWVPLWPRLKLPICPLLQDEIRAATEKEYILDMLLCSREYDWSRDTKSGQHHHPPNPTYHHHASLLGFSSAILPENRSCEILIISLDLSSNEFASIYLDIWSNTWCTGELLPLVEYYQQ
jgi:hypothetical protein